MAARTSRPTGPIKSSIVARLNARLFFRLLGIYLLLDILLILLFWGGLIVWSDRQAAELKALAEKQGAPSEEAAAWMSAGSYSVAEAEGDPNGILLPHWLPSPQALEGDQRWFDPGTVHLIPLMIFSTGGPTSYTLVTQVQGQDLAITLDLSRPAALFVFAGRVVLICQLVSLVLNLFKNAGTIRRTLRPIQDLAAAATRLGGSMSPEELQALAGELDEINASHLDRRIPVTGAQKELKALAQAINAMLDRINEAYRSQTRFVSDASHELRTPIAVIQGYASLLDRWGKDDPATRQEAIDAIRQEADSMKQLVEQLLFLARGDNDSVPFHPQLCDLSELAAEVLRETQMLDHTHQLEGKWLCAVPVVAD